MTNIRYVTKYSTPEKRYFSSNEAEVRKGAVQKLFFESTPILQRIENLCNIFFKHQLSKLSNPYWQEIVF